MADSELLRKFGYSGQQTQVKLIQKLVPQPGPFTNKETETPSSLRSHQLWVGWISPEQGAAFAQVAALRWDTLAFVFSLGTLPAPPNGLHQVQLICHCVEPPRLS